MILPCVFRYKHPRAREEKDSCQMSKKKDQKAWRRYWRDLQALAEEKTHISGFRGLATLTERDLKDIFCTLTTPCPNYPQAMKDLEALCKAFSQITLHPGEIIGLKSREISSPPDKLRSLPAGWWKKKENGSVPD